VYCGFFIFFLHIVCGQTTIQFLSFFVADEHFIKSIVQFVFGVHSVDDTWVDSSKVSDGFCFSNSEGICFNISLFLVQPLKKSAGVFPMLQVVESPISI